MRRRLASTRLGAVLTAGVLATAVCTAAPALADDPAQTGGVAYSSAFDFTPGGVGATVTTTGLVGALVAPLVNPVLAAVTGTLLPAVNTLATTIQNALLSAVTQNGLKATTPQYQVADPAPAFPNCTSANWSPTTCYSAGGLGIPANPVIGLSVPTVRGYTVADSSTAHGQPFVGRAEVAHAAISLLGLTIGDLGVVDSTSTCATYGSNPAAPAPTSSVAGLSLLGGLITVNAADTKAGLANVLVGGQPLVSAQSITTPTGLPVSVHLDSGLLTVSIGLNLDTLLKGLGLDAISGLVDPLVNSNLSLDLHIGPGNQSATKGMQTWGLEVKANLAGTLNLSLLGLVGAAVTVTPAPGAATDGDLLDLKIASTNCTSGLTAKSDIWIPPGLI